MISFRISFCGFFSSLWLWKSFRFTKGKLEYDGNTQGHIFNFTAVRKARPRCPILNRGKGIKLKHSLHLLAHVWTLRASQNQWRFTSWQNKPQLSELTILSPCSALHRWHQQHQTRGQSSRAMRISVLYLLQNNAMIKSNLPSTWSTFNVLFCNNLPRYGQSYYYEPKDLTRL